MKKTITVALTLCAFSLVCIWAVSGIKQTTNARITENIRQALISQLNAVISPSQYDNDLLKSQTEKTIVLHGITQTITLYQAKQKGKHVAYLIKHIYPQGYSGDILLLSAVSKNNELLAMRVISHRETPGLGDKIETKKSPWITQLSYLLPSAKENWQVKKDGGSFDAITGATITSNAVISAGYDVLTYVQNNLN